MPRHEQGPDAHLGRHGRIAILHFSAEPCVGGVEQVVEAQRRILEGLGFAVRLIVGSGGRCHDVVCLQALRPEPRLSSQDFPVEDDPDVGVLVSALERAMDGCSECWVHNALTVYLSPILTLALLRLIPLRPDIRWVVFCHDLTQASTFQPQLTENLRNRLRLPPNIICVADSRARQQQLAAISGLREADIQVIRPPLDVHTWLSLGEQAEMVAGVSGLRDAGAVILVPAKLLPHKNLELALRATAALQSRVAHPALLITGAPSPHEPTLSRRLGAELYALADDLHMTDNFTIITDVLGEPPHHATVRDLMLLADLVLVPSAEEGFGLPLQEAMALRTPLLCSDIPPFREIAGGYAHFFSLGSRPEQVADQLESILSNPANVQRRAALRSLADYERSIAGLVDNPLPGDVRTP